MNTRLALAAAILAAPLVLACGTPDSTFPSEPECLALEPLPTSRSVAGVASPQAFVDFVRQSTVQLSLLRNQFVNRYPDDTFYRRDAFRPDVAAYADETICIATRLRAIDSPIAGLDAWTARVHLALDELIAHTRFGREAVRTRNVSEYRQYRAELNQRLSALEVVAFTSP